jgi:hypothetical protein
MNSESTVMSSSSKITGAVRWLFGLSSSWLVHVLSLQRERGLSFTWRNDFREGIIIYSEIFLILSQPLPSKQNCIHNETLVLLYVKTDKLTYSRPHSGRLVAVALMLKSRKLAS